MTLWPVLILIYALSVFMVANKMSVDENINMCWICLLYTSDAADE